MTPHELPEHRQAAEGRTTGTTWHPIRYACALIRPQRWRSPPVVKRCASAIWCRPSLWGRLANVCGDAWKFLRGSR